jgi:hypothetical protein
MATSGDSNPSKQMFGLKWSLSDIWRIVDSLEVHLATLLLGSRTLIFECRQISRSFRHPVGMQESYLGDLSDNSNSCIACDIWFYRLKYLLLLFLIVVRSALRIQIRCTTMCQHHTDYTQATAFMSAFQHPSQVKYE